MASNDLPLPNPAPESADTHSVASTPKLGDVVDSIEDAATTLSRIVCAEAESLADDARSLIREKPIAAVATVGLVAYVFGRIMR